MKIEDITKKELNPYTNEFVNVQDTKKLYSMFENDKEDISFDKNNTEKYYHEKNYVKALIGDQWETFKKAKIIDYYLKKYNVKTVLEMGFGAGTTSLFLLLNNYEVDMIDFEHSGYTLMQNISKTFDIKTNIYSFNKQTLKDIPKKYDAVLSMQVLEHIKDPLPIHEDSLKLCDKVLVLEEYCGTEDEAFEHIAPIEAKDFIINLNVRYGLDYEENPFYIVPSFWLRRK